MLNYATETRPLPQAVLTRSLAHVHDFISALARDQLATKFLLE
jgi:hypothetical protein